MKHIKRAISVLLCAAMIFSLASAAANAEEDPAPAKDPFAVKRVSACVKGADGTSVGLCWFTEEAAEGAEAELVGEDGKVLTGEAEPHEWEGNFYYKVSFDGLKKNSSYTYTVGAGENTVDGAFTTGGGDKVSFVNIADVQASSDENFAKGAAVLAAGLEKLPDADFISNLGDFTNDSDNEEWDLYAKNFDSLHTQKLLVPVAGNHDGFGVWHWFENTFNLDTSASVQTLNGVNYSFDYGNAHFAVLNTNDLASVSLSQLRWLKKDMDATDKDWKIVFMHKSPYTLGKDGKWPDAMYLKASLVYVLDSCGVDLVMSGHDHQYLRTKPLKGNAVSDGGVTYVLSGTAGTKRYEIRKFLAGYFLDTRSIDTLVIQKDGYGNYWDGSDWDQTDEDNIGGCFETVEIEGGELNLNAYILSDEKQTLKLIDTLTLTKETGLNKGRAVGDNTTSKLGYALGVLPSFTGLALYSFGIWLPRFLMMLPKLLYIYIKEDTF